MKNITSLYEQSFIKAVIEANKKLYKYINFEIKDIDIQYSNTTGYGGDNSLNIDLYAEKLFISYLKDYGNIFSEECGFLNFNHQYTIVIDPIDGSNNIFSDLEYYGSSIALKDKEKTIAGFVCNLATGKLIYKAFDEEIQQISFDNKNILNTYGKKIAIFERAYKYPKICEQLSQRNIKFRALGSVALSLANSRNYEFVLFKGNIREFDIAAALYICSGLYVYKNNNTLLISENKDKFNIVKELLKK